MLLGFGKSEMSSVELVLFIYLMAVLGDVGEVRRYEVSELRRLPQC